MRALVTGGGGFLGRALVEECLDRGLEVTSAGRSPQPAIEALGARTERLDYLAAQDEAHARERLSNQARALEAQDAARAEKLEDIGAGAVSAGLGVG